MAVTDINTITWTGNLTKEPEVVETKGGAKILKFRIASNAQRKISDEWVDHPNYINVEMFGNKRVEAVSQWLDKGTPVCVSGELNYNEWQDKNGGGTRSEHRIVIRTSSGDLKAYRRSPNGAPSPSTKETVSVEAEDQQDF